MRLYSRTTPRATYSRGKYRRSAKRAARQCGPLITATVGRSHKYERFKHTPAGDRYNRPIFVLGGRRRARELLRCGQCRLIRRGGIPPHTLRTLQAWIGTGRYLDDETDVFCQAVLMNDLQATVAHADEANLAALRQIVAWLQNHAPLGSWGTPGALGSWPRICARSRRQQSVNRHRMTTETS